MMMFYFRTLGFLFFPSPLALLCSAPPCRLEAEEDALCMANINLLLLILLFLCVPWSDDFHESSQWLQMILACYCYVCACSSWGSKYDVRSCPQVVPVDHLRME
jgi:hypothetical protein